MSWSAVFQTKLGDWDRICEDLQNLQASRQPRSQDERPWERGWRAAFSALFISKNVETNWIVWTVMGRKKAIVNKILLKCGLVINARNQVHYKKDWSYWRAFSAPGAIGRKKAGKLHRLPNVTEAVNNLSKSSIYK